MSEHVEPSGSTPRLAEILLSEQSLDELLQMVVDLARRSVPGVDGASVTLVRDGRMGSSNCSDDVIRDLDRVQYQAGAGPCVDAARKGRVTSVVIEDHPAGRYAPFIAAARSRFMTAVLSTPLRVREHSVGGLNLYSRSVGRFGADAVDQAAAFARQASVVLANAVAYSSATSRNQSLQQALATRETIGTAKGIIMATKGCSADEAFGLLRTWSQHQNRKVRDVALDLISSIEAEGTVFDGAAGSALR
jgi:GAF domain-containing protein